MPTLLTLVVWTVCVFVLGFVIGTYYEASKDSHDDYFI